MKSHDTDDRKYKVLSSADSNNFEQLLNASEEDGWKLHSWNFCDNSYNVTYIALMVRETNRNLVG